MDGQKHHVGQLLPVSSSGCAGTGCLPWAAVQAEREAAPSGLDGQLEPRHSSGASHAPGIERQPPCYLWDGESAAVLKASGKERPPPPKSKLNCSTSVAVAAHPSLPLPPLQAPIWKHRGERHQKDHVAPDAASMLVLTAYVQESRGEPSLTPLQATDPRSPQPVGRTNCKGTNRCCSLAPQNLVE